MQTEKEKMLAGELYDCGDPELLAMWRRGKNLMRQYNTTDYADSATLESLLGTWLGSKGCNTWITAPFYADYGCFIRLGDNCEINMNCVFLDCNWITIGSHALIAPGVQIYTVFHPVRAADRFHVSEARDGRSEFPFAISRTAPVTIGEHVWIGGSSIIMPGVTIGNNVTVGAGSVVTHSIPDNKLAYGNPCRVVRDL